MRGMLPSFESQKMVTSAHMRNHILHIEYLKYNYISKLSHKKTETVKYHSLCFLNNFQL